MFDLTGKRILITQNSLHKIAGSEVNTLEFAKYLTSKGADVTVYTLFLSNPMLGYFDGIKVIVGDDEKLSFVDFDLIWIHQQIIPLSLIDELNTIQKIPPVVFFYMSSTVNIELPYTKDLENTIGSKVLYVSKEAEQHQLAYRKSTNLISYDIFPNPAPLEFSEFNPSISAVKQKKLKRILVVSNHPPDEIIKASEILESNNITVTFRGETNKGTPSLISANELAKYNCIISIGKTVQYCLCQGVPVYIYDHFGGPGYLNESNFSLSKEKNFAGRGFDKKAADEIAQDITERYDEAIGYYNDNRKKFTDLFSIDNVLPPAVWELNAKKINLPGSEYVLYLKLVHNLIKESVVNQNNAIKLLQIKNDEYSVNQEEIIRLRDVERSYDDYKNTHKDHIKIGSYVLNSRVLRRMWRIKTGSN